MRRVFDFMFGMDRTPDRVEWLRRWRLPIMIVLAVLFWDLLIGLGWLIFDILTTEPARADILLK